MIEALPQKYPFLFIDRVLEINEAEKRITCLKNVTINDYFFAGHFPGNPVMPGVLITEAMAQASILLYMKLKPDIAKLNPDYYLGRTDVRFLKPVKVGDQLILEISANKILSNAGIVDAKAICNKQIMAQGAITFGVKVKSG